MQPLNVFDIEVKQLLVRFGQLPPQPLDILVGVSPLIGTEENDSVAILVRSLVVLQQPVKKNVEKFG